VVQNGLPAYEIEAVGKTQLLAVQVSELEVKQLGAGPVGVRVMLTVSPGDKELKG
jgi:methylglyoxal synthase